MNPLEETDPKDKGNFSNGSLWGRIVTIFSGPLANYLFASVFFFGAIVYGGKPAYVTVNDEPQLATYVDTLPDRPARAAGMLPGDKIVEVAGTPVASWNQMAEQISKRPGERIQVIVERTSEGREERATLEITPSNEDGKGKIGVAPFPMPVPLKEAALTALTDPPKVVKSIGAGLAQLFKGNTEDLGGPLRIMKETSDAAKQGLAAYLSLLGVLSAYIGIFNLLPFPALDGGRLVFLGYEAVTRRKPNAMVEVYTNAIGILSLLGLALYITFFKDLPHMLSK
jgi:regulator of sigma E protease